LKGSGAIVAETVDSVADFDEVYPYAHHTQRTAKIAE
jgi:hypothetical protein